MRVILHIGVHKTATSAIQYALYQNADKLLEQGIFYQAVPGYRNHHPLAWDFDTRNSNIAKGKESLYALLGGASKSGAHTALISSEMLCESQTDVHAFVDALEGHDIRVIAYIRSPDGIVLSAYNQDVREDRVRRKESLETTDIGYDPTYRNALDRWLSIFDPERLVLAPYDRKQWTSGSILADFLHMVGADASSFDTEVPSTKANASLPFALTEALRLVNKTSMTGDKRNTLIAEFYQLAADRPELFPSVDFVPVEFRDGLRRMYLDEAERLRPYYREGFQEESWLVADDPASLSAFRRR